MIKTTARGDQAPAFHMKIWKYRPLQTSWEATTAGQLAVVASQLVCSAVVCMVLTSFVTKKEEANKMEKLGQFQMVQSFKILTLN